MRKSYVNEASLVVNIQIDLGEVNNLVEVLAELDTEDSTNYRAKDLRNKLKALRRDAVDEAASEFERMLEKF